MGPAKISEMMYRFLTPLSRTLILIGGICLTMMMFLTTCDVSLRYFFNRPIDGAFDITEYLMVVVFTFGLPYCTIKKEHVKVDILMERFPKIAQALINCATTAISIALFSLIAWQSLVAMGIQYETGIVSSVLLIPRYPFLGLLFLGYFSFAVILIAELFALIAEVGKK